jgi:hypothetical protein
MGDHDGLESVITIGWNAHGGTVFKIRTEIGPVLQRCMDGGLDASVRESPG